MDVSGSTTTITARTAIAPAIWGTIYLVTTEFLPTGQPLWIALLRALPAGLLLLALRPRLPSGTWWWRSLLLGTLNIGLFNAMLFIAATRLPGGVSATLSATQVVFVLFVAAGLLGERITAAKLAAGLIAVLGVGLLVLRGESSFDPIGVLAGLGTALSITFGMVLTRRWGTPPGVPPLALTSWQLLGGSAFLLPLALVFEGAPPALDGPAVAGLAWVSLIGTALTYVIFFAGVHRLPAAATSLLGMASPLVATLLGWLVLGQTLTIGQLGGLVLVLLAVVFGQRAAAAAPTTARSATPSARTSQRQRL